MDHQYITKGRYITGRDRTASASAWCAASAQAKGTVAATKPAGKTCQRTQSSRSAPTGSATAGSAALGTASSTACEDGGANPAHLWKWSTVGLSASSQHQQSGARSVVTVSAQCAQSAHSQFTVSMQPAHSRCTVIVQPAHNPSTVGKSSAHTSHAVSTHVA